MIRGAMLPEPAGRPAAAREGRYDVERITTLAALGAFEAEWESLWRRSDESNPFLHPAWLATWARWFVPDGALEVLAVRRSGALVGVLPLWRRRWGPAGRGLVSLHPLGAGHHCYLTEMPGALLAPEHRRPAWRAAVGEALGGSRRWDYLECTLGPGHGWFEPEWAKVAGQRPGIVVHKGTRAMVTLGLDGGVPPFKRNLRESLRRSHNRLNRHGDWRIDVGRSLGEVNGALRTLVELHRDRSRVVSRVPHRDCFRNPRDLAFALDAFGLMAGAGLAETRTLRLGGTPVAGLAVLRGRRTAFVSFSGLHPRAWEYSPTTLLVADALDAAVARGDSQFNLSAGPNVAKLRWSEHLELHQDFVVVAPRREAEVKFAGLWAARAFYTVFREVGRVRPTAPP